MNFLIVFELNRRVFNKITLIIFLLGILIWLFYKLLLLEYYRPTSKNNEAPKFGRNIIMRVLFFFNKNNFEDNRMEYKGLKKVNLKPLYKKSSKSRNLSLKVESVKRSRKSRNKILINQKIKERLLKNRKEEIETDSYANSILTKESIVIGAKTIGRSHIETSSVCQDNFSLGQINRETGIAVVSDGAGSAKNSQFGSKFVSERSVKIFSKIIESEIGIQKINDLSEEDWSEWAKKGLYQVRLDLEEFSKKENLELGSLACTVILVVYHKDGLLVAHIGDGRAGYLSNSNEWAPLITPFKGEEANETVFLTSNIWKEEYIDNYLSSSLYKMKYKSFTLMSDGCETHSYSCSKFDQETQIWEDPNLPYPKFFNPLVNGILKMKKEGNSKEEIEGKWIEFLKSGTEGLLNEPDDKTLVLGVFENIES